MNRILGLGATALAVVGLVSGCSGGAGKDGLNAEGSPRSEAI